MVYFASVLGPTFVIEMLGMPHPGPYGIVLHRWFLDLTTNHRPYDCIIRAIPLLAGPHAGSFSPSSTVDGLARQVVLDT
jgi:hypothetical protein